jgi:Bacterial low temperature requirement A protein (LtrA)
MGTRSPYGAVRRAENPARRPAWRRDHLTANGGRGGLAGGWGAAGRLDPDAAVAGALLVEGVGAYLTSRHGNWRLHSVAHLTERHGLFIILAIGESVVAIGVATDSWRRTAKPGSTWPWRPTPMGTCR